MVMKDALAYFEQRALFRPGEVVGRATPVVLSLCHLICQNRLGLAMVDFS